MILAMSNDASRKAELFQVRKIEFLGEQDGPPERLLKTKLVKFFHHERSVFDAFLTRVDYGEGKAVGVVLALTTKHASKQDIVEKIGTIFASVFGAKEHLDILFLTDEQLMHVRK